MAQCLLGFNQNYELSKDPTVQPLTSFDHYSAFATQIEESGTSILNTLD